MGTVRVWLAILIVLHHARQFALPYSNVIHLVDGEIGFHVTLFILISGFYIQRSLDAIRAKETHWLRVFYQRRFLRIFPGYYLMLGLYLLIFSLLPALGHFFPFPVLSWERLHSPPSDGASLMFWANNMFLLFSTNNMIAEGLTRLHVEIPFFGIFDSLIVTQSWSLSVELFCYLLAPLLLIRNTALLVVFFLTASILGYVWQPTVFNQTMIPHQLPFFLYGAVMCRLYGILKTRPSPWLLSRRCGWIALMVVMVASVIILLPGWMNGAEQRLLVLLLGLCGACLPSIAELTQGWAHDRLLGEMSYPVYLSHILFFLLAFQAGATGVGVIVLSFALTLAYAFGSVVWFERPIRRLFP